jgi:1-acyl-sn-glycerol-3-phosphate acyltransferase
VTVSIYHLLRTLFFLIPAIGFYTIVAGTVGPISALWDPVGRFGNSVMRTWSWLVLVTTGVRVDVSGLDRLVPGATYVFVSNHQSMYDIPAIFRGLPYQLRIIAKQSLGWVPFLGWHLRWTGHVLVNRRHPDRSGILRQWRSLVAQQVSLVVFPEGTRSADGRVGKFKAGSFAVAIEAGVPVVPISVVGSRFVLRKGELTTRPGFVQLTLHAPIDTRDGTWSSTVNDARRLAAQAQQVIAEAVERIERERVPWPSR